MWTWWAGWMSYSLLSIKRRSTAGVFTFHPLFGRMGARTSIGVAVGEKKGGWAYSGGLGGNSGAWAVAGGSGDPATTGPQRGVPGGGVGRQNCRLNGGGVLEAFATTLPVSERREIPSGRWDLQGVSPFVQVFRRGGSWTLVQSQPCPGPIRSNTLRRPPVCTTVPGCESGHEREKGRVALRFKVCLLGGEWAGRETRPRTCRPHGCTGRETRTQRGAWLNLSRPLQGAVKPSPTRFSFRRVCGNGGRFRVCIDETRGASPARVPSVE